MAKEEEKKQEKEKTNDSEAKIVETPVQFGIAYQIGGEVVDERELLVRIYNDIQKIKRSVA